MKKLAILGAAAAIVASSFAATTTSGAPTTKVMTKSQMLQNNLAYFQYGVGIDPKLNLPYDHITLDSSNTKILTQAKYFNPTELGLYLNIMQAIVQGKIPNTMITQNQAKVRMIKTLQEMTTIQQTLSWNGLFNWYQILPNGQITSNSYGGVSTVDNGNLVWSLAGIVGGMSQYKDAQSKQIVSLAQNIINNETTGWSQLYFPSVGLMSGGYDYNNKQYIQHYYLDRTYNEPRTAIVYAICATQNLAPDQQVPVSAFTNEGRNYTSYTLGGKQVQLLMTWDGGFFQAYLPALFLNETRYSTLIKQQDAYLLQAQQEYMQASGGAALESASSSVDNGYNAYGVPKTAEGVVLFGNAPATGTGTPYADGLLGTVDNAQSITMLQTLAQKYPQIVTKYGFSDAINPQGQVANTLITLDQGMLILGMLGNFDSSNIQTYINSHNWDAKIHSIYKTIDDQPVYKQTL